MGNGQAVQFAIGKGSPLTNVPIHRFLSGTQVLTNDIYAWETIEIGADADLQAPSPSSFSIIAGKEIIVSPDAKIAPNITLKIALPNGCTEDYKPVAPSFINDFCGNKYDLNKRKIPETGPNISDEEEKLISAPTSSHLPSENMLDSTVSRQKKLLDFRLEVYPNPTSGQATLSLHLPQGGPVSAQLSDMQGRLLQEVLPPARLPAGEHLFELPTAGLPPGMYLITVRTPEGPVAVRLAKQ